MVSAITQAQLQRTQTLRQLAQKLQGDNPGSAESIAAFEQRTAQGLDAINKLEAAKVDVKKQRKEQAKLRLEQLKQRLRMLKMFGASSKTVARLAAQLAREIGAAVRAYAGNDGGGSATPVDDGNLAFGGSQAQGDAGVAADDEGSADSAGDDAAANESEAGNEGAANADAEVPGLAAANDAQHAQPAQDGGNRDEDRAFYQDAKNMLAQLKRLIEEQQHKARQKKNEAGQALLADAHVTVDTVARNVTQAANEAPAVAVIPFTPPSVRISV